MISDYDRLTHSEGSAFVRKGSMKIEVRKGLVRWYYRSVSRNGNILSVSQKYYSKSNALRAAKKVARQLKCKLVVVG